MLIVVLADEDLKSELLAQGIQENVRVEWVNKPEAMLQLSNADAYVDLLFENDAKRIAILRKLLPKPVLVNSVISGLKELSRDFIRFNGWKTFLSRAIIEATALDEKRQSKTEEIFSLFNKKIEWTADISGFISARVIAMIINEAYFALNEEVSSKEEIDIAMKLGTNYPYGPFEWAEKIGLKNVYELLDNLSKTNNRYMPNELLIKEVFSK